MAFRIFWGHPDAGPADIPLTPSPVVLTLAIPAPSIVPVYTLSAAVARLTLAIPAPSISSGIFPDPVVLTLVVPAPTLTPPPDGGGDPAGFADIRVRVGIKWDGISWTEEALDGNENVMSVSIERGRSDIDGEYAPGTCRIVLRNIDDRYSPLNSSGALYGKLLSGKRVRVIIDFDGYHEYQFVGKIIEIYHLPHINEQRVEILCKDLFAELSKAPAVINTVYGYLTSEIVNELLGNLDEDNVFIERLQTDGATSAWLLNLTSFTVRASDDFSKPNRAYTVTEAAYPPYDGLPRGGSTYDTINIYPGKARPSETFTITQSDVTGTLTADVLVYKPDTADRVVFGWKSASAITAPNVGTRLHGLSGFSFQDAECQATFVSHSAGAPLQGLFLHARFSYSTYSGIIVEAGSDRWRLYAKSADGTVNDTLLDSYVATPTTGDVVKLICSGTAISVYINGTLRMSGTSSINATTGGNWHVGRRLIVGLTSATPTTGDEVGFEDWRITSLLVQDQIDDHDARFSTTDGPALSGTNYVDMGDESDWTASGDFTLEFAFTPQTWPCPIIGKEDAYGAFIDATGRPYGQITISATDYATPTAGVPAVYLNRQFWGAVRRSGSVLSLWIDGAQVAQRVIAGTVDDPAEALRFGESGGDFAEGTAEFAAYFPSAVSDANLAVHHSLFEDYYPQREIQVGVATIDRYAGTNISNTSAIQELAREEISGATYIARDGRIVWLNRYGRTQRTAIAVLNAAAITNDPLAVREDDFYDSVEALLASELVADIGNTYTIYSLQSPAYDLTTVQIFWANLPLEPGYSAPGNTIRGKWHDPNLVVGQGGIDSDDFIFQASTAEIRESVIGWNDADASVVLHSFEYDAKGFVAVLNNTSAARIYLQAFVIDWDSDNATAVSTSGNETWASITVDTDLPTKTRNKRTLNYRWNRNLDDIKANVEKKAALMGTAPYIHPRPTVSLVGKNSATILNILRGDLAERVEVDETTRGYIDGDYFIEHISMTIEPGVILKANWLLMDEALVEADYTI